MKKIKANQPTMAEVSAQLSASNLDGDEKSAARYFIGLLPLVKEVIASSGKPASELEPVDILTHWLPEATNTNTPRMEWHLRRCFAQGGFDTSRDWNNALKLFPIDIKQLKGFVCERGFPIYQINISGRKTTQEASLPQLACWVGMILQSRNRAEITSSKEKAAFKKAMTTDVFLKGLRIARKMEGQIWVATAHDVAGGEGEGESVVVAKEFEVAFTEMQKQLSEADWQRLVA